MRLTIAIALATLTPTVLSAQTQVQSEASITSATIEACYVKSSGTIYRINAPNTPSKCSTNGTPFSWNNQGPQGPAGPAGPQGPVGPQGPAGSGLAGYEVVVENFTNLPQGQDLGMGATCPAGKIVIGGGYEVTVDATHQIMASKPYNVGGEPLPSRWGISLKTVGGLGLMVFAICVTAPS